VIEKSKIIRIFEKHGFPLARLISGSKSGYRSMHLDNLVVFNANVICRSHKERVWRGDLDITLDGDKLRAVAKEIGEPLYVFHEQFIEFGAKNMIAVKEILETALWSTDPEFVSKIYSEYVDGDQRRAM